MKPYKILIPIAPDQNLEDDRFRFLSAADSTPCSVTLVSVIEDFKTLRVRYSDRLSSIELLDEAKLIERARLAQRMEHLRAQYPAIHFDTEVLAGIGFIRLIEYAHQHQFHLIALMARSTPLRSAWFGSTTQHLLRKSTRPVLTLTPHAKPIRKVMIAVDAAADTPAEIAFNDQIAAEGFAWAAHHRAEVVLCHAWQLEGEGYLKYWSRKDDLDIALMAETERASREQVLVRLAERHARGDLSPKISLVEGRPQDVIPPLLEKLDIDLLVMGTVCRTGIPGFIIGNTAESMIHTVNCSVLALKPQGFVSPVEIKEGR